MIVTREREKLLNAMVFFCQKTKHCHTLKLFKLLNFLDFEHYRQAGRTVWFVVFIALVGFFLYAMRPVLQAWAVECTPRHLAGSGVGLQFGITAIGASLGPLLAGIISDAADLYTGFYFLAGTIVAANVLMYFMPAETTAPQAA